jgi:tetratricopeptide (TPR) repeat protein
MHSVFLSVLLGLVFGFGGFLLDWWHWVWAILFAVVVALVAFVLIARRLGKRLQPMLMRVQQQMEARMPEAAMQSLRELLPHGKWMPLLEGQIYAQMGMLAFQMQKRDEAMALLKKSSRRLPDGQLVLAVMQYRGGDKEAAFLTLKLAGMVSKKHALLHNLHAFLLAKEGKVDQAIAVLAAFTKKNLTDEASKDNLLRLQNGKKMSMKPFGVIWYALGFETPPPEMGVMQQARKGFRTPPKQRGG